MNTNVKPIYWTIYFTYLIHSEADDFSVCQKVGIASNHMAKMPNINMLDELA
jgi:hypothetical protein